MFLKAESLLGGECVRIPSPLLWLKEFPPVGISKLRSFIHQLIP